MSHLDSSMALITCPGLFTLTLAGASSQSFVSTLQSSSSSLLACELREDYAFKQLEGLAVTVSVEAVACRRAGLTVWPRERELTVIRSPYCGIPGASVTIPPVLLSRVGFKACGLKAVSGTSSIIEGVSGNSSANVFISKQQKAMPSPHFMVAVCT
ncbi:uncharacterized protein BKA55DRAFT_209975 [Fusarium redolens]|uniref:Uncharacterized protein n=1 Tax=Fusarium redolens TaxID=48865 RepID=A0A9P9FZK7_FUSRE|nr:uncharacterized protein BKA55DRAFT_209975 [Fusarium redolens]KAH7228478.1 hypothetical protein BKA55DRAFT_209975 [Fusarium redolens]